MRYQKFQSLWKHIFSVSLERADWQKPVSFTMIMIMVLGLSPHAVAKDVNVAAILDEYYPLVSLDNSDQSHITAGFKAIDQKKWANVARHYHNITDPQMKSVIGWFLYTAPRSGQSFEDIAFYLQGHPNWPGQRLLRRRAEEAITADTDNQLLADWFQQFPPISLKGAGRYAQYLVSNGQSNQAREMLREIWVAGRFGASVEKSFLALHKQYLSEQDHIARLEKLLWDGRLNDAKRMLSRVPTDHKSAANARFLLAKRHKSASRAVAALPGKLQNSPGVLFERLRWRRRHDRYEDALNILLNPPQQLGNAEKWWTERSRLGREALRRGDITYAYQMVSDHRLSQGVGFAEGEFLSGWIATRFLQEARVGYGHFTDLFRGVTSPISLARGAYWSGRAALAAGDQKLARGWYETAAQFFTTYYGQLAAQSLGMKVAPSLPEREDPTSKEYQYFAYRDLVHIVRRLAEFGQLKKIDKFVYFLTDNIQSAGEQILLADLCRSLGRIDLSLRIAKKSARKGMVLLEYAYPVITVPQNRAGVEKALILSVIRQESAFQFTAKSHVGARGLMQLMPQTAKLVAKQVGLPYSASKLTADPDYNMQLGTAYLASMLDRFDGSYILALASYNAGPGRADRWIREYGDPRNPEIDPIDWVEIIPFSETRNYVQRIMESVQVYRHLLQQHPIRFDLMEDLMR